VKKASTNQKLVILLVQRVPVVQLHKTLVLKNAFTVLEDKTPREAHRTAQRVKLGNFVQNKLKSLMERQDNPNRVQCVLNVRKVSFLPLGQRNAMSARLDSPSTPRAIDASSVLWAKHVQARENAVI
jgi:hypothetical protein